MARPRKDAAVDGVTLDPAKAPQAFAAIGAQLSELADESVLAVEGDVAAVANQVLSAVPRLSELRARWEAELPALPTSHLDALPSLAHAAWYADLIWKHASTDATGSSLEAEAAALRETLLIGAEPLAHRGLLDKEKIAAAKAGTGNLADDLVSLASLYSSEWAKVAGKTVVENKEVERALKIGSELSFGLAAKKAASGTGANDPAQVRARAYTLLVQGYDAARRAVSYLRWNEGDADTVAPALPKKRAPRKSRSDADTVAQENGSVDIAAS